MEFYMLVLALDTTTRRGSVALVRDGVEVESYSVDEGITHGRRLPGDLMRALDRQKLAVGDVDLFAVAAGPGSFTGLRIGIATMQGLALATGRSLVGVSALDALHHACGRTLTGAGPVPASGVGVCMDGQRGEVFAALYHDGVMVDGPLAATSADVLARWCEWARPRPITFIGEGAILHARLIAQTIPHATVVAEVPALAPSIARLAEDQVLRQGPAPPDAIRPIYVRRPDVELARNRKAQP